MGADLQNSYEEANNKLRAFKSYAEAKQGIDKAIQKAQNQNQPNFDLSSFQLDQAEIERKIKKKVQGQFEQLLNLVAANKGSGNGTGAFLIKKFVSTVKVLSKKLPDILIEETIKALGCQLEQTFIPQDIYVKTSSIDLFKILKMSPLSSPGKLLYETQEINVFNVPRATNKLLRERIDNPDQFLSEQYSQEYLGYSTNRLFDIAWTETYSGDSEGWYVVRLVNKPSVAPGTPVRVTEFITDYYKTLKIIDFKALVTNLMEALFGIVSIKLRFGTTTIDDSTKFGLLVQRILGLCFDEEQEISVGGQAKTPELDDTTDSFFEITGVEQGIIDQRISRILNGIISYDTCDNVELPILTDDILEIIEQVQFIEDGDALEQTLVKITNQLSNDPRWSLQFPFPDQLKVTLDFDIVKNLSLAVVSTVLSPKTILPFITMIKALGIEYDDSLKGLTNFTRQNRELMKNLVSRIGAEFVRTLFLEIKKDIRNLARGIIADISKDDQATLYVMIERLVAIAIAISSIVKDFRRCKSVIDAILQLFALLPSNQGKIPKPLLLLTSLLPGSSPTRSFINGIENMQRLGLPTGANLDGTPNLGLQSVFAQMKATDRENKENGKLEGMILTPSGPRKLFGKSI